ncbi:MAG: AraC family transcriptional regulator, partial [Pseudomonadota bacterium]|nr:AraC family transcriptional regulator [Pseudomonadota bacterium]
RMSPARFINPDGELDFAKAKVRPADRPIRQLSGLSIEYVRLPHERFEYNVRGNSHYLALHDIELQDGEVELADGHRSHRHSLGDRMTYVPAGCQVTGWSVPKMRRNAFTALYFDASMLAEEFRTGFVSRSPPPFLYALDASLKMTLEKLANAITVGVGAAYLESLCLVAVGDLLQMRAMRLGRQLSEAQVDRILEFVEAHMEDDLSVEDLAKVVDLSRFHFSRMFKTTTSQSPYQFLLDRRIRRASDLLRSSNFTIGDIALKCGFRSVPQFEEAFRRAMGARPARYRADLG